MRSEENTIQIPDEGEAKLLTATDHYPVFTTNKVKVGSATLDLEINEIYKKYFKERGFDDSQIDDVIGIIMSVQTKDEDKALEQTLRLIRRYCTENKVEPELSNALGIQVHQAYKIMRGQTVARNIAGALVQKEEKKRLRSAKRVITAFCDIMGVTQYEMGSLLIGGSKD